MDHADDAAVVQRRKQFAISSNARTIRTSSCSTIFRERSAKTCRLRTSADLRRVIESVRDGLEELVLAYPSMLHRLRDLMLAELQVPNVSPQSLAELRDRAENIRQLAGDFRLDAFVGRLSQFDGSDESIEGIASLAANKPPRDWVDPDLDQAAIELADMAQKFLRTETYARVKGRPDKRQAMAVDHRHKRSPRAAAGGIRHRRFRPRDRQRSDRTSDHHAGTIRHQPP